MRNKDVYCIFIEDQNEKCVIKATKDYDWRLEILAGKEPLNLNLSYSNRLLIDDLMDELRENYDYVEEIDFTDIDDYIED